MTPQEELDFQWVVGRLRSLNDLRPPAPQTSRVQGPAIDAYVGDQQVPSTSYALPRSRMMESLISDVNARLSLDKGCMKEQKKVKGLLPAPLPRHRRYYQESGSAGNPPTLNDSMAELLKSSLDKASKKDVFFSAAEAKELDGSISSITSVTSWLDHWLSAFGRSALDPTKDEASIRRLLQSGSKALFFLARQSNNLWANLRLKRREAVLSDLATGCTPEDISALRNGSLDDSGYLFPQEIVRDVLERKRVRAESKLLQKAAFPEGKKRSSPSRSHGSSGSGRPAKTQKTSAASTTQADSSNQDQGSSQSFSRTPGRSKGKKKGKGKKRGGAN